MNDLTKRQENGHWKAGVSGNPGGRAKGFRAQQLRILEKYGPRADEVMDELLRLATGATKTVFSREGEPYESVDGGVRVKAASIFLQHACPAPKVDEKDGDETVDPSEAVEKATDALLANPATREMLKARLGVIDGGKK